MKNLILFVVFASLFAGCTYKLNEAVVDPDIHSIKVNFIENKASYVNPQLSPRLTDRLRQKIVSQTKLTQTNNDNADMVLNGTIVTYTVSTSGISQQNVSTNRLTVGVRVTVINQKKNESNDYDVSRSFEFPASQTIQQAEVSRGDEIIRSLTDDIFNKIFSKW